jgi:SAM-dependent methyltransferase
MYTGAEYYKHVEFEYWSTREKLFSWESFLIERYLSPAGRTLDGGTGGGRIALELSARGFEHVSAFDFLQDFIDVARRRDTASRIEFSCQDATRLHFENESFDQIIYFQQLISLIPSSEGRDAAVGEAARVLREGGTALFSFLSYEGRMSRPVCAAFTRYLQLVRFLAGKSEIPLQLQPSLTANHRFNYEAMLDRLPYVYWFRAEEVVSLLDRHGLRLKGITTQKAAAREKIYDDVRSMDRADHGGIIMCICEKRRTVN